MKKEILKIVGKIKENLKSIDDDGIYHKLLDSVFEDAEQIEDIIYNDDINSGYGIEEEEDFE
jgi:hypothetical protein